MGSLYKYSKDDLENLVKKIINTSETTLEIMGKNCKIFFLEKNSIYLLTHSEKKNKNHI